MSTSICQYHGAKSIYNSTCQYQYINMDMSISLCQYQYVNIIMSISIQYQEVGINMSISLCRYHYVVISMSLYRYHIAWICHNVNMSISICHHQSLNQTILRLIRTLYHQ